MSSILKVIAVITMVLDHIGLVFFPEIEIFRIVGRLSLPLFAYCIAEGYKHTSDIKKYIIRIFSLAVLAQIPFSILFGTMLNILFAFALSLMLLLLKDKYSRWIYLFLIPAALINIEYGIYSMILVIIFHEFQDKKAVMITAFVTATLIYTVTQNSVIQISSIFALYIIHYLKEIKIKMPKYAFYVFYPVQWMLFALLHNLLPG